MVVPRFVKWALNNEPVLIYGTGQQKRCFCYVGDLIDAIVDLMDCPQAAGKVYNVGSNEETSVSQLADKIIEMTGSKSKKEFVPYEKAYGTPMEDMMRRVPSIERIGKTIGWKPATSLEQALRIIIEEARKED